MGCELQTQAGPALQALLAAIHALSKVVCVQVRGVQEGGGLQVAAVPVPHCVLFMSPLCVLSWGSVWHVTTVAAMWAGMRWRRQHVLAALCLMLSIQCVGDCGAFTQCQVLPCDSGTVIAAKPSSLMHMPNTSAGAVLLICHQAAMARFACTLVLTVLCCCCCRCHCFCYWCFLLSSCMAGVLGWQPVAVM